MYIYFPMCEASVQMCDLGLLAQCEYLGAFINIVLW